MSDDSAKTIELISMWVSPTARGAGVGDALINAVTTWAASQEARIVELCVKASNIPARRLYERHEFLVDGAGVANDEIRMIRTLSLRTQSDGCSPTGIWWHSGGARGTSPSLRARPKKRRLCERCITAVGPPSGLNMVHLLGFGGSALIILSTTMRSVVRLRLLALVGSGIFVVYGFVLPAWPVAVTNIVTSSVHLFHLAHLRRLRNAGPRSPTSAQSFRRWAGGRRRVSA